MERGRRRLTQDRFPRHHNLLINLSKIRFNLCSRLPTHLHMRPFRTLLIVLAHAALTVGAKRNKAAPPPPIKECEVSTGLVYSVLGALAVILVGTLAGLIITRGKRYFRKLCDEAFDAVDIDKTGSVDVKVRVRDDCEVTTRRLLSRASSLAVAFKHMHCYRRPLAGAVRCGAPCVPEAEQDRERQAARGQE